VSSLQSVTPLMWAVAGKHDDILDYLLSTGTDVNIMTLVRRRILDYILLTSLIFFPMVYLQQGYTVLHFACSNAAVDTAYKLIKHGADINIEDEVTPTQWNITVFNTNSLRRTVKKR
jgi:ankyrin repeat protein